MTREAEAEYRCAFEEFSRKAQRVQSLAAENAHGKVFETALLELERAHLAYNQARDTFLQSLLPESFRLPAVDKQDQGGNISPIAELLWESAGRPDGTAQEDWKRAEDIVKHAKRAVATASCH
jgi:Protein of unknown function (DUF2934)